MNVHVLTTQDIKRILSAEESGKLYRAFGCTDKDFRILLQNQSDDDNVCYVYAEQDGTYLSKLILVPELLSLKESTSLVFWAGNLTKNDEIKSNSSPAIVLMKAIEVTDCKLFIASYSRKAAPLYSRMKKANLLKPFYQRTLSCVFFRFKADFVREKKSYPTFLRPVVSIVLGCVNIYNRIVLGLKHRNRGDEIEIQIPDEISDDVVTFIDAELKRDFSSRDGRFFQGIISSFNQSIMDIPAHELRNSKTGFGIVIKDRKTRGIRLFSYCVVNHGILKVKYLIGESSTNTMTTLFLKLINLSLQKNLLGIEVSTDYEREALKRLLSGSISYSHERRKECLSSIKIDESLYEFHAGIGDNIAF